MEYESDVPQRYCIIKWNNIRRKRGCPRFEIRPTPIVDDCDYSIVEESTSFRMASVMVKKLEAEEALI